jgi:hypothetical protein
MAAGLVSTTSRSGTLGAIAGCLTLAVFALKGKWAARATVGSLAVAGAALAVIVTSPLRLLNDDPAVLRLHLWRDAARMLLARPLTGWGEDSTGLAFGHFLSGNWSPGVTFDRVHSAPLDIAVTQGLIGLAALAWVLLVLLRGAWRYRFAGAVGPLTAACVGYAVWALFNFDWAPATGLFWLVAGSAWSGVRAAENEGAPRASPSSLPGLSGQLARLGLALLAVAAAVLMGVLPLLADIWYFQGRVDLSVMADPLQARYHWALGQDLVAEALLTGGVNELRTASQLGETEPSLYVELGDNEVKLGLAAQARADYRRALEIDPYYAPALQRLAAS